MENFIYESTPKVPHWVPYITMCSWTIYAEDNLVSVRRQMEMLLYPILKNAIFRWNGLTTMRWKLTLLNSNSGLCHQNILNHKNSLLVTMSAFSPKQILKSRGVTNELSRNILVYARWKRQGNRMLSLEYPYILKANPKCSLPQFCCQEFWLLPQVCAFLQTEKIQERSLRILFNDYGSDVHHLFDSTGSHTHVLRRLRCMLLEVYKCI